MHDIFMQSTLGEKWSITRICTENISAHSITSISPLLIAKLSFTHKRYIPKTEITALIQTTALTLFLKNSPRTGTIMIYNAVKKPAFPTVVCIMPIC